MKSSHLLAASLCLLAVSSCKKDNDPIPDPAPTMVKEWNIALSAKNENPAPASRNETGTAVLQLFSDNSIKYSINVTALAPSDALMAAHIHTGDVITNGGVILNFNPSFSGGSASGTLTGIRASFVDSLKNDVNELYFNVHSSQVGSGIVRGQLNTKMELAVDVPLSGANEVPAITTTATGLALLRLTASKKLYYRINVSGLEAGDALSAAHIHRAASGVNGGVIIGLHSGAADFGTIKMLTLDDTQFAAVKADAIYVNVHSTNRPSGIIRGQVR